MRPWLRISIFGACLLCPLAQAGPIGPINLPGSGAATCDPLKPEQTLTAERQRDLDAALSLSIKGLLGQGGGGAGSVDSSSTKTTTIQVLQDDALAKSWFVYQTCVMKTTGVIDEATAQELVRSLMGLEPTTVTVTTGPPAAGPDGAAPVADERIRMASATTETQEVADARKAAKKAGGKVVKAQVEMKKKAGGSIEDAVKQALIAAAQAEGYARVVEVLVFVECGGSKCKAEADGVAVQ